MKKTIATLALVVLALALLHSKGLGWRPR